MSNPNAYDDQAEARSMYGEDFGIDMTAERRENIEQASGGIPSAAVWAEARRVLDSLLTDNDDAVLTEFSVHPASADSTYSLLNTGEMCFEIVSVSYDTDGNMHDATTFIGESGKFYGMHADGVEYDAEGVHLDDPGRA